MDTAYLIYSDKEMTKSKIPSKIDTQEEVKRNMVRFDLPPEQEKKEELLSPCVTSPAIDINAHIVPDTMLVALYDRSSEMKDLVRHNKSFFLTLASHLDAKWSRFENTLYCDRSVMSDLEWMNRISKALSSVPSLLEKFKELVGYLGEDDDEEDEEDSFYSNVDLTKIRSKTNRISKDAYPQFFINCQQTMGDQSIIFLNTLFKSSSELDDNTWELKINQQLRNFPNILEQLQEIVAYEIEE